MSKPNELNVAAGGQPYDYGRGHAARFNHWHVGDQCDVKTRRLCAARANKTVWPAGRRQPPQSGQVQAECVCIDWLLCPGGRTNSMSKAIRWREANGDVELL